MSKSVGLAAALETIPATIPHNTLIDKVSSEIIKETVKKKKFLSNVKECQSCLLFVQIQI